MRKIILLFGLFICSAAHSQLLEDAFSDDNFTTNLVWTGNSDFNWTIIPDSEVGGITTLGSRTLRLNNSASGNYYLSTVNSIWGSSQDWGLWWGRQGALDAGNSQYFWLFSDRADVTDTVGDGVNGFRLSLIPGILEGDPELLQLQKIFKGEPVQVIIEIEFPLPDPDFPVPITDFGFALKITRSETNLWTIFSDFDIVNTVSGTGQPATTSGFDAVGNPINRSAQESITPEAPNVPISGTGYMSVQTYSTKAVIDLDAGGPEFDNIQFQAKGSLPVTLESLKAVKDGSSKARLDWKVGIEDNVKGYEVERSPNGINFSKIGFVQATGSRNYQFVDQEILQGKNFYRLKTVDNDGTYKYSFIVSVNGVSESSVKVFPNPVNSKLYVQHISAGEKAQLRIFGVSGQLMQSIRIPENAVQTNINVEALKPGIYNLIYDNGNGERQVSKFVKQ